MGWNSMALISTKQTLWERSVLTVGTKSSAVLKVDFFVLWEFNSAKMRQYRRY